MELDIAAEWKRLTEHYREMYDEELLDLSAGSADLTEVAQQVLRDEIKRRGLDKAAQPADVADPANAGDSNPLSDSSSEFTWKTFLCECENNEQAWQISEVLRRAGIETWLESPRSQFSSQIIRVCVAADQLDQAKAITDQPIPQHIVDESKDESPEFELPSCPSCGAADPVLESVDPVNAWACESCGREWSDSAKDVDGEAV